jgi:hypothetical protein
VLRLQQTTIDFVIVISISFDATDFPFNRLTLCFAKMGYAKSFFVV